MTRRMGNTYVKCVSKMMHIVFRIKFMDKYAHLTKAITERVVKMVKWTIFFPPVVCWGDAQVKIDASTEAFLPNCLYSIWRIFFATKQITWEKSGVRELPYERDYWIIASRFQNNEYLPKLTLLSTGKSAPFFSTRFNAYSPCFFVIARIGQFW